MRGFYHYTSPPTLFTELSQSPPLSPTHIHSQRSDNTPYRDHHLLANYHTPTTPPNNVHRVPCYRPHHDTNVPRELSATPALDFDSGNTLSPFRSYPITNTTILEHHPTRRHPPSNSPVDPCNHYPQTLSYNLVYYRRYTTLP